MFFKCHLSPAAGAQAQGNMRSLAFIEEYWRFKHLSDDVLCCEFGCVRLYSTEPKVYYVIDAWRILGPAPITLDPARPTIPLDALSRSAVARKRDYPSAKADTSPGAGDEKPMYVLNNWAFKWGSHKPTAGTRANIPPRALEAPPPPYLRVPFGFSLPLEETASPTVSRLSLNLSHEKKLP